MKKSRESSLRDLEKLLGLRLTAFGFYNTGAQCMQLVSRSENQWHTFWAGDERAIDECLVDNYDFPIVNNHACDEANQTDEKPDFSRASTQLQL